MKDKINFKEISGGVCAPIGFRAGGIYSGIKANSKKRDLALIYSEKPCKASAMYTGNRVKAAPLQVTREHLKDGILHAIIVNSGNANACTGEAGINTARRMAVLAADLFALSPNHVAVASTGVIGVPLPINAIESSIEALGNSLRGDETGHAAAYEAIMTTDTRKKEASIETEINGKTIRIGAMLKGAGMIHPNMATMLCFITTDALIAPDALDISLKQAVKRSINRVIVDGDTSTNDMVIIMANGQAGNEIINAGSTSHEIFTGVLEKLCVKLSRALARDGEGASKLLTVSVSGAENEDNAELLARTVAGSSLVKAAFFGCDANWGRILCAMGYSGADFNPEEVDVSFAANGEEIMVCKNGSSLPFSEPDAKRIISCEEVEVLVKAGKGSGAAIVWGCDLTLDYVKINGSYRS